MLEEVVASLVDDDECAARPAAGRCGTSMPCVIINLAVSCRCRIGSTPSAEPAGGTLMGSRYLLEPSADVCGWWFLPEVVGREEGAWQSRAGGSGGYDTGYPDRVIVHRTASSRSVLTR